MMKCIILEYPDGSIAIRGRLGPEMLSRFDNDEDTALRYILDELVPVQNPDAVGARIVERAIIPTDRWFRNAWTPPVGSGPIKINIPKARETQVEKIRLAREQEISRLENEEAKARLTGQTADAGKYAADRATLVAMNFTAIAASIASAGNPTALKAVWPAGLPPQ